MSRASTLKSEIMTNNFTNEELDQLAEAVKWARSQLTRQVARSLRPGDRVRFTSNRNGQTYTGLLEEIKIKNAIISTQQGRYRVPMNMLEIV